MLVLRTPPEAQAQELYRALPPPLPPLPRLRRRHHPVAILRFRSRRLLVRIRRVPGTPMRYVEAYGPLMLLSVVSYRL
eukprot:5255083-Pyramimonas_sp.AAC.1